MDQLHMPHERVSSTLLDKGMVWGLSVLVALIPVIFIPLAAAPFQFTKSLIITSGALVLFMLFIVSRMQARSASIPMSPLWFSVWAIPLSYLVSTLFSVSPSLSVYGLNISTDSLVFVVIGALLLALGAWILKTQESIAMVYVAVLAAFFLLALFHAVRLMLGPEALTFGVFDTGTASPFGTLYDLALFAGLVGVLSLITLVGFSLARPFQIIIGIALVCSIGFLALINFPIVWWLLGLTAFSTFVWSLFQEIGTTTGRGARISFGSLVVLAVSALFIFGDIETTSYLARTLDVTYTEVRPSWQGTIEVARASLKDNLLFGSGPATFSYEWAEHKPVSVNETILWSTEFRNGVSMLSTVLVTGGLFGIASWFLFLGLFFWTGIRAIILRQAEDGFSSYFVTSSFVAAAYLWITALLYTPGVVIVSLAFLLTGVFIASLRMRGDVKEYTIPFTNNPRLGFIIVLGMTLLFLFSISGIYMVGKYYAGTMAFQKAMIALNQEGDVSKAETNLARAIALSPEDRHYRLATSLNGIRLTEIVRRAEAASSQELQNEFLGTFGITIQNARTATDLEPRNYENWLNLGDVYQGALSLRAPEAYEEASRAYTRAREIAPNNPLIPLRLAELEVANGTPGEAKKYIEEALQKKNNYTAAIFLLSQIQVDEGNLADAIVSVEAVSNITPYDPTVFFQLGVLRYANNDTSGAVAALENAVALNPSYANARYFLGLSYSRQNRLKEALEQFEEVQKTNEENEELKNFIENLRKGRTPFGEPSSRPADDIRKQEGLPVIDTEDASSEGEE